MAFDTTRTTSSFFHRTVTSPFSFFLHRIYSIIHLYITPIPKSYTKKQVELHDWWLTKSPETQNYDDNGDTLVIGVAGLTFIPQKIRVRRCFYTAPILKVHDYVELETVDGAFVILKGFINKEHTLKNGFPPQVFDHFVFGFPLNWKDFATNCPKSSAAKCVARGLVLSPHEDGKDSIKGHADFHDGSPSYSQQRDIYTVDMEVQDCKDTILNNKTTTVCNAPSYETPQEHIVKAGHEVPCERSPVTSEFEADSSLWASPIVRKAVDSSTAFKRLRVSSRRMTRSMTKEDISKTNSPLLNDISNLNKVPLIDLGKVGSCDILRMDKVDALPKNKAVNAVDCEVESESGKTILNFLEGCGKGSSETAICSEDIDSRMKSKRKQKDQNVDITEDTRNKSTSQVGISNQGESKDADASSKSQIDTRRYDSKENETAVFSKDNVLRINSKRKQNDQNVDDARKKLTFQVGISSQRKSMDAGVSSESQIGIKKCDLRPKRYKSGCSDPFTNTSVGVGSLVNASTSVIAKMDDAVPLRTNMKACRNKEKGQEGVASKDEIAFKKVIIHSKSRSKLKSASSRHGSPKKQLITGPKTRSRAKKASKEKCGSEYVLSPGSFSGKKSRSGRVLLPSLQFWRNQRVVYDQDGEVCGVEERV